MDIANIFIKQSEHYSDKHYITQVNEGIEIKVALFDFGGVLAEEGFRAGLVAIAEKNSLDPINVIKTGFKIVYDLGFVTGKAGESEFWSAFRQQTGIKSSDQILRGEILSRFTLRPWMLEVVCSLREKGVSVGILSDQTNWLDELNDRYNFFQYFDYIFNSFHSGFSKKDLEGFDYVLKKINVNPEKVLFIDDHHSNIERAKAVGMRTIHYKQKEMFIEELRSLFSIIV